MTTLILLITLIFLTLYLAEQTFPNPMWFKNLMNVLAVILLAIFFLYLLGYHPTWQL